MPASPRAKLTLPSAFQFLLFALTAGLACLLNGCASAPSPARSGGAAELLEATGKTQVAVAGRNWATARPGTTLHAGDKIRTGKKSEATVSLGENGGVMRIMENSVVELERIGPKDSEPEVLAIVFLSAGRIIGDTQHPPTHGKVIIRTLGGTHELR